MQHPSRDVTIVEREKKKGERKQARIKLYGLLTVVSRSGSSSSWWLLKSNNSISYGLFDVWMSSRENQIPIILFGQQREKKRATKCVFFFYTRTHLEIMLSRLLDGMHKSVYCLNSWRGCCSVWTDGSEMRIERYIRKREKSCGWAKSNETLKTSVYYNSGSSISFAVRLYRLHQQVIIRFFFVLLFVLCILLRA